MRSLIIYFVAFSLVILTLDAAHAPQSVKTEVLEIGNGVAGGLLLIHGPALLQQGEQAIEHIRKRVGRRAGRVASGRTYQRVVGLAYRVGVSPWAEPITLLVLLALALIGSHGGPVDWLDKVLTSVIRGILYGTATTVSGYALNRLRRISLAPRALRLMPSRALHTA